MEKLKTHEVKHGHQTLKKPNQTKVAIKSVYEKTCMVHLFCSVQTGQSLARVITATFSPLVPFPLLPILLCEALLRVQQPGKIPILRNGLPPNELPVLLASLRT